MAQAVLNVTMPQTDAVQPQTHNRRNTMKKLLAIALLAFAVPAFAHVANDEAKPADKSAKKAGKGDKKDGKKDGEEKKDEGAGDKK
jgi:hypothetical protein